MNERQMMAAIYRAAEEIYTRELVRGENSLDNTVDAQKIMRWINILERLYGYIETRPTR